jgi:energy-coupling factor transporter ATP-binding protein EcfA2
MVVYNFHVQAGNDAVALASEGRGKLPEQRSLAAEQSLLSAYRAAHAGLDEAQLLAALGATIGRQVAPSFLAEVYTALKSSSLLVLIGRQGRGKVALVRSLAAALLGPESPQLVQIAGDDWTDSTGNRNYFRSVHGYFGLVRVHDALRDATLEANRGRLYIILISSLYPQDLQHYIEHVLTESLPPPHNALDQAVPGNNCQRRLLIPPNVLVVATINLDDDPDYSPDCLPVAATCIDVDSSPPLPTVFTRPALLPPPGYQRMLMKNAIRDPQLAEQRLVELLGPHTLRQIGPSWELAGQLRRRRLQLDEDMRRAIITFVANSFTGDGRGLFDPHNRRRNAQLAFDLQVWRRLDPARRGQGLGSPTYTHKMKE